MRNFIFPIFLLFCVPFLTNAAYDADFQRGYNFPSWWFDSYSQSWSDDSLKELLVHKPGWIAVGPFWYQQDGASTMIYAHGTRTANDAGVEHVIQMAHNNGVKVMLKPLVDAESGRWRGRFQPRDTDAWFASYTVMAVHYAMLAERLKVASYVIGGEYETLSGPLYANKWREVVRAVRQQYKGEIGYGANWGKKGQAEYEKINWWDALDFIGIHAYFPIATTKSATLDDMVKGWTNITFEGNEEHWLDQIAAVQEKYNKPVIFSEAGYKSCDGGTIIPWWCDPHASVDLQEQSDGAESLLKVFQDRPWLKGIFWWMWNIKPWYGGSTDKDHNMNRKPVMDVIKKYWGVATAPLLPPPSIPPSAPPDTPQPVKGETGESSTTIEPVKSERDVTPPGAPTHVVLQERDGVVTITWQDPPDNDFASIIVLRNRGGMTPVDGGRIYGRVKPGVKKFIDADGERGVTYRYMLRADDTTGNAEFNMDVYEITVSVPPSIGIQFPSLVPGGFTPVIALPKARILFAAEAPPAPIFTAPQKSSVQRAPLQDGCKGALCSYGVPRKSRVEERAAEKRMWRAVGKSFGWRRPKLKPGEWTTALRAYLYGGYPVDVIRNFLHHKRGIVIHPTKRWKR